MIRFDDRLALFDDPYVSFDGLLLAGEEGEVEVSEEQEGGVTIAHASVGGVEIGHD